MLQPDITTAPSATSNIAQRLKAQQGAIKLEANTALANFAEHLKALMGEANDLSGLESVFPRQVIENLNKFVTNTRSALDVFEPAAKTALAAKPSEQPKAIAA